MTGLAYPPAERPRAPLRSFPGLIFRLAVHGIAPGRFILKIVVSDRTAGRVADLKRFRVTQNSDR